MLDDPARLRADHIQDLFMISVEHSTHEVWARDLWELREAMRANVGRVAR
jgi:hypothetical protein